MRLYTPAKPSSSGGDETERDSTTVTRPEKTFRYEPRPPNDKPRDDKLPRGDDTTTTTTTTTITTTTPPHIIQDSNSLSPLREDTKNGGQTEVNGEDHNSKQNGTSRHEHSPSLLQNGSDSISSLDSVPWNLDGIETIRENGCKTLLGKWALEENGDDTHALQDEDELQAIKEENKKLKTALKEAAEVNGQWRQYHEQRQQYVQRLLTTLHDLQHPRPAAHSPRQQLEVDQGGPEGEARRLQEALTRLQADHDEHVTLLEMQVRAHRDDWEAERSEKQATQTALAEAQARTALLLQELQLLQAKLADSESKRSLCWRCAGPIGGESHSASPSTHASPVPAPSAPSSSPAPAVSPTPLQEAPQAPLKGWIPVSMLHQIAFSGATPEHQTPVVQRPVTPSRGQPQNHHHHHHHHHKQRPNSLSTDQGVGGRAGESKAPSPRRTPSRDKTPGAGEADDRKKYEAMGARPKVLGNLQTVAGKEEEFVEDEKTAKHRARSILASALPVSPVSGGPATPFGVTKSPSTPNMPKGYVPITSTILTPINFRPPFVAHKRPSAIKQSTVQNTTSSTTTTTTTTTTSSPSSTTSTAMTTATTTTTSVNRSTPTPNRQTNTSSATVESQGSVQSTNHTPDTSKSSANTTHESKTAKSHSRGSKTQVKTGTQDRRKSSSAASPAAAATPTLTTTTLSTHSTNMTSHTNTATITDITTVSPSSLSTTTTTTISSSSSSPTPSTSFSASSPNRKSDVAPSRGTVASSRGASQPARDVSSHQSLSNAGSQAATTVRSSSFTTTTTVSPSVTSSSSQTKNHDTVSNSKGRNGASRTSHKGAKTPSPLPESSTTAANPAEGQLHSGVATTGSHSSPTNSTAFAAITVTSTASSVHVPPSPSTYSSTPSSRSSSPGISLTTFGLNSEGRGIPGAIFFALSPEQRGTRSPQHGVSSRRASTSSSGTHSHTPDPVTGSHPADGRPPAGIKSPPVAPNRPTTPSTVREEHWWSEEGESRASTTSRQQHGTPGKLVNSTWVKLMGSRADGRQSSGLPWRTARAVSGQTLKQARRPASEDSTGDPSEPTSPGSVSSTATFNCTPAVNSPPSSANSSAGSSPLPAVNHRDDLKSMASKNITSAIMSYELSTKSESAGSSVPPKVNCPDGVDTLTRHDLVCPSCQMLFPHDKHILFLDHFEACRGPAYADL